MIVKDGLEELKLAIENIRDSVAYWTATPKRVEKFEEIAKHCKVKIEQKIHLDCKTRWNSAFKMLSIALPYKAVFIRANRVDRQYTCCKDRMPKRGGEFGLLLKTKAIKTKLLKAQFPMQTTYAF